MNILILLIALILSGCNHSIYSLDHQFKVEGRYITNVPFFPQEDNYCGPAALAGILNYYGHKITQEDIAGEVFTPKLKGTITVEMASFAKRAGLSASYYKGSVENIEAEIDKGHPLILYIDTGYYIFPSGHYITVVGYDRVREGIIAYSGRDKDTFIPYKKLIRSWEKTGCWTLLILPDDLKGEN